MSKATKYHEMKTDELVNELKDLKEKLFRLRFQHATGQLANPLEMANCKKNIARIKTILRERAIVPDPKKTAPSVVTKKAKAVK